MNGIARRFSRTWKSGPSGLLGSRQRLRRSSLLQSATTSRSCVRLVPAIPRARLDTLPMRRSACPFSSRSVTRRESARDNASVVGWCANARLLSSVKIALICCDDTRCSQSRFSLPPGTARRTVVARPVARNAIATERPGVLAAAKTLSQVDPSAILNRLFLTHPRECHPPTCVAESPD
jgi:hypothetical protein